MVPSWNEQFEASIGPISQVSDNLTDGALAGRLASAAGRVLMDLRRDSSLSGADLGRAGDAVANAFLTGALARVRPEQWVLSEESPDDPARLGQDAVWIVDPLDGSREFGERRQDFAVHVALAVKGSPVAGAVALPALGVTYSTADPPVLGPVGLGQVRIVVSRTCPPDFVDRLAEALGAQIVPMGSMGAKTMAVVRGDAVAYVHAAGQHEWDSCAPVAVAGAVGLYAADLSGRPLRFNQRQVLQPGLVVCRSELVPSMRDLLASEGR